MLARAGLGDDALDAQAFREQGLADGVVDLVRARVGEVLALQPHFGTPAFAEPRRMRQRRRPSDPLAQLALVIGLEPGVVQVLAHAGLETLERRHQRLGDVAPAERTEAAAFVRQFAGDHCLQQRRGFVRLDQGCHAFFSTARAVLINRLIRPGSL